MSRPLTPTDQSKSAGNLKPLIDSPHEEPGGPPRLPLSSLQPGLRKGAYKNP